MVKAFLARDIKNMNRKSIYRYIASHSDEITSCAKIARATHISLPTVIKITDFFQREGVLKGVDAVVNSSVGRPPSLLRFDANSHFTIGVSYDGNYLSTAAVNLSGDIIASEWMDFKTPISTLLNETLPETIDRMLLSLKLTDEKLIGIGLALPVILDTKNLRTDHPAPFIGLHEPFDFTPTARTISSRYGCPFFMENDVNSAAIGEFKTGEYSGNEDLIYITLGSGVGGGVILDGKLRRGSSYSAGEVGYMILNTDNLTVKSESGYVETRLSPEFIKSQFGYDAYERVYDYPRETVVRVAEHISAYLSVCIANLAIVLDVDTFVIGGFLISGLGDLVIKFTHEKLQRYALNPINIRYATTIYSSALGIGVLAVEKSIDSILDSEQ